MTTAVPDSLRPLAVAGPGEAPSYAVVGDTYTVLVPGEATAGRYALIDMHVPPGGGPAPHRHACDEVFLVLEGAIEAACRDRRLRAGPGTAVNVPAGAPHQFRNPGPGPARLLCVVAPAGLDRFFAEGGDRVPTRTSPPPPLDEAGRGAREERMRRLAPGYQVEFLPPDTFGDLA